MPGWLSHGSGIKSGGRDTYGLGMEAAPEVDGLSAYGRLDDWLRIRAGNEQFSGVVLVQ